MILTKKSTITTLITVWQTTSILIEGPAYTFDTKGFDLLQFLEDPFTLPSLFFYLVLVVSGFLFSKNKVQLV